MHCRELFRFLSAAIFGICATIVNPACGGADTAPSFQLATFSADITPPIGSPLCGGWIEPANVIDDPLRAVGIVLLGSGKPIVLCALDWVETNNESYDAWREALAAAAGTDSSRVAVQCVHPHNAPWANLRANELLQNAGYRTQVVDPHAFHEAVKRTASAVKESLQSARPITHVGTGEARVDRVASTRRVMGDDGRVALVRMSRAKTAEAKAATEGLIDPFLKALSFWDGDKPIAALHYYATHPMSFYGDGRVTSDFCGLARDLRQKENPDVHQVYFNGCAGDITAGKYNEGTPAARVVLRDRIRNGMEAAWNATTRAPLQTVEWHVLPVRFAARTEEDFSQAALQRTLTDPGTRGNKRSIAAIKLSWLARVQKPIEMTCLRLGDANIVNLPGEPFVQYQLFAQQQRPDGFVCVAGYGDGGPGYIPLRDSYAQGGYEPTMSFVPPETEELLNDAIQKLLQH
jgi:hypothetical protein